MILPQITGKNVMSTEIDTPSDEFSSACAHCECADFYRQDIGRVHCWVEHRDMDVRPVCSLIDDRTADKLACYDALRRNR